MIVPLNGCVPELLQRLSAGEVVAVPGPRPFPYVVCAISPDAVNYAKGRETTRSVIVILDDLAKIRRFVPLEDNLFTFAASLAAQERLHLLLPYNQDLPDLYEGATRDGYLGVSTAWHEGLSFMLHGPNPLFASSANASGCEPLVSASEVDALFDGRLLVVVDPDSDGKDSQSGGIVRIAPDSSITLIRSGFQIAASGMGPEEYVQQLQARRQRYSIQPYKFNSQATGHRAIGSS